MAQPCTLGMAEQLPVTAKSQQRTNPGGSIKPGFSVKLEALRGVAALMVVGFHTFQDPWTRILFNGGAAVTVFFVLSGYVLGLSLRRGTGTLLQQFCLFLWHRVFRIYPAYFITTLAFWIYWQCYPFGTGGLGSHSFFENLHLSRLQQIKNFIFLDQSINPVTWSLKVEMIGSIVLPLLHFLSRKLRWRGRMLLFAAMLLLSFVTASGSSRQRLYMFYLGYLIVDVERLPKFADRVYSMIMCVAVGLFVASHFLEASGWLHFELLVQAVSAAGIILCIQAGGGSLGGLLNHRWTHFAGRVSFSIFLSHWMTLDVVGQLLYRSPMQIIFQYCPDYLSIWLRLLVSLPFVLLVAAALYHWIEVPFIKLGKTRGPVARWRTAKTL
jgi:peptidoglycan/LPS O-acetylase OafA/YrhL